MTAEPAHVGKSVYGPDLEGCRGTRGQAVLARSGKGSACLRFFREVETVSKGLQGHSI